MPAGTCPAGGDSTNAQSLVPSIELGNKAQLPVFEKNRLEKNEQNNSSPPVAKRSKRLLEKENESESAISSEGWLNK